MEKIICRSMSLTETDFSFEEEEGEEIELKLGLSIGGVYQNLNPAVKDESLSVGGGTSNSNEEENPSRSIGCSLSFDGDEMDPDTKREIHAARRKEAKRKRQEKRQKVETTRCNEKNSIVYVASRMYQIPSRNSFGDGDGDGEAPQVDNAVRPDPSQSLSRCSSSTGSENLSSRSHSNPDQHHKSNIMRDDGIDQKPPNATELSSRKRKGKSISSSKNTIMLACEEETNLNKGKPPKPQTTKPNISNGSSFPYMPCVSTTGNGPNGKTINGFLYKYTKSEEVTIVCVCHGKTFSPAEFLQHAGGIDLSHPLKHINVIPSAF